MSVNIFNRIKSEQEKSSKMFKRISTYLLENRYEIPLLNLQELSEKSGASTATIIRFCKSLDFTGYSEFQTKLKDLLKNEIIPTREFQQSIMSPKEGYSTFTEIIDANIGMLEELKSEEVFNTLEESVELLDKAGKIYIIGNRLSYSFAYYFFYLMKGMEEKVEMITAERQDFTHKLLYVKPDDVVMSICFYPYVNFSYKMTEYMKKIGCKIICLTDTKDSPFVPLADKVLYAYNNNSTYSFISALSLLNSLVTLYGKKNKQSSLEKMEKLKEITSDNKIYFEF